MICKTFIFILILNILKNRLDLLCRKQKHQFDIVCLISSVISARTNHKSITYLKLKVAVLTQTSGTCPLGIEYLELDLDRISSWRHVTMTLDTKIKQSYSRIANIIMSYHICVCAVQKSSVIWRKE